MTPFFRVLALIPARGGSKGVPGKNIARLGGHPLIAYSIEAARQSKTVERIIVSTDSPEIAAVARAYGAETPFLRPAELAADASPDRDFLVHALDWLAANEGAEPELILHLRPTTPLRDPALIDAAIGALSARTQASSLRSAHPLSEPPQKMLGIEDGFFTGLFPHETRPDYPNLPRQAFPQAYQPNGYADVLRTSQIRGHASIHGPRILGFVTPFAAEIDSPRDLEFLEFLIERKGHPLLDALDRGYPAPKTERDEKDGE